MNATLKQRGTRFIRNAGNHLPDRKVSFPRDHLPILSHFGRSADRPLRTPVMLDCMNVDCFTMNV